MRMFARLVPPGGCVLDVGGHIGYVALYFASLVGRQGHVYVFEPVPNNLRYLCKNVAPHSEITVIEKAVGSDEGQLKMYVESLTGQNCSFLRDYVVQRNAERAGMAGPPIYEADVEVVSLDHFVQSEGIRPDFVKIDVEGFEWEVLQGAARLLSEVKPMLMVEMRRNQETVLDALTRGGYRLFTPRMEPIRTAEDCRDNAFCFHAEVHARIIRELLPVAA